MKSSHLLNLGNPRKVKENLSSILDRAALDSIETEIEGKRSCATGPCQALLQLREEAVESKLASEDLATLLRCIQCLARSTTLRLRRLFDGHARPSEIRTAAK